MSTSEFVIEVGDATFEHDVVERSKEVPVLVDFWAPWCGPCRALTPTLESLAAEGNGSWILAKINTDEHQEVAARFGIRGIPNVKAFVNGEVVDEFSGALPRHLVTSFIERVLPSEAELVLDEAHQALEQGDPAVARSLYQARLAEDPDQPEARVGLALVFLAEGDADAASRELSKVGESAEKLVEKSFAEAWLKIEAAQVAPEPELLAALDSDSNALDAYYGLAVCAGARADYGRALELFLELVKKDRGYREDIGRRGMIRVFALLGEEDPLTNHWRAQLGRWMY